MRAGELLKNAAEAEFVTERDIIILQSDTLGQLATISSFILYRDSTGCPANMPIHLRFVHFSFSFNQIHI